MWSAYSSAFYGLHRGTVYHQPSATVDTEHVRTAKEDLSFRTAINTVRRSGGISVILAPPTNVKTYLLTYLLNYLMTTGINKTQSAVNQVIVSPLRGRLAGQ